MRTITSKKLDHMPAELIEPILLNLPVKSLFRFSTASKLWNSIIFRPEFAQSYRGREMIVFKSRRRDEYGHLIDNPPLACPLSSMSSDNPIDETMPFDVPPGYLLASCGYLWCFEFENSLLLYNPSIQIYRKLPNPEMETDRIYGYADPVYVYGLGYDSVSDDYKILKIRYDGETTEADMYSLTSDCWRKVESQPPEFSKFLSKEGLFVSGAIHWLITRTVWIEDVGKHIEKNNILSFDLSEEKFGLIELPELQRIFRSQLLDMIVFGGKLRVHLSCVDVPADDSHFSVWVMEDYEAKLWKKEMAFDYGHMRRLYHNHLKPFYFYDRVGNLVRVVTRFYMRKTMFIYKEEDGSSSTPTLVEKIFGSNGFDIIDSFTYYIESFVSPLTWHGSSTKADDDGGVKTK